MPKLLTVDWLGYMIRRTYQRELSANWARCHGLKGGSSHRISHPSFSHAPFVDVHQFRSLLGHSDTQNFNKVDGGIGTQEFRTLSCCCQEYSLADIHTVYCYEVNRTEKVIDIFYGGLHIKFSNTTALL